MAKREPAMVRAMGMGMKVLSLLVEEVQKQGGDERAIELLTRPRYEENLTAVGKAIASCDWRIPLSEMRVLAEKSYRRNFAVNKKLLDEVRNLWWYGPCHDFGIPFSSYCSDPDYGDPAIPSALKRLLHGRTMEYPLRFEHGIHKKVVVNWGTKGQSWIAPGHLIDIDIVDVVAVTDQKYFDFDK